jgi:nicotinic acid mononucleotide adenylyltransferase
MVYETLNKSQWRGIISEVGIGVNFTNELLLTPGASNTVLSSDSPYEDRTRPKDIRAVSLDNALRLARDNRSQAWTLLTTPESYPEQHFGLAITGAHYEDRASQAWVALATKDWEAHMHVCLPANIDRREAARRLTKMIEWFIEGCMFLETNWIDHITNRPDLGTIDVLAGPGVSDFEHLLLLGPETPLVYHNFEFQRVTDYVRQYSKVYPGAFNPPTARHLQVEDCLYEISKRHYYKGGLSTEDLLHRMRMLNLEGRPVLVTESPRFIDKHNVITAAGGRELKFVLGADAWNRTIIAHQYPNDEWLGKHMAGTSFLVMPRKGEEIKENQVSRHLAWSILDDDYFVEHSSTAVRTAEVSAEHEFLTQPIAEYISKQGLYDGISNQKKAAKAEA